MKNIDCDQEIKAPEAKNVDAPIMVGAESSVAPDEAPGQLGQFLALTLTIPKMKSPVNDPKLIPVGPGPRPSLAVRGSCVASSAGDDESSFPEFIYTCYTNNKCDVVTADGGKCTDKTFKILPEWWTAEASARYILKPGFWEGAGTHCAKDSKTYWECDTCCQDAAMRKVHALQDAYGGFARNVALEYDLPKWKKTCKQDCPRNGV